MNDAIACLAALAQETRLAIFRLLIRQGPNGLPAGEIADRLEVAPSTLSFHLGQMQHSGLLRRHRVQRQIFYAADLEATRALLAYLTEDCCEGRPEICGGIMEAASVCGTPNVAAGAKAGTVVGRKT